MEFLTLSEKEITAVDSYNRLHKNHLLISIKEPGTIVEIPNIQYRKALLELEFVDTEDFNDNCFDRSLARQILQFVNDNCDEAEMIVVSCPDGLSRSNAIASALSKILNHGDDQIFSNGIPNIFTYLTLLDTYFTESTNERWTSLDYIRDKALQQNLSPMTYKIYTMRKGN